MIQDSIHAGTIEQPILESEYSNAINKHTCESTPAQPPRSAPGRFCTALQSVPQRRRQASAQIVAVGRTGGLQRSSSWVSIHRLAASLGTCFLFRRLLRSGGRFSLRRRLSVAWRGIPWVGRAWLGTCHSILFAKRLEMPFVGLEMWGSRVGDSRWGPWWDIMRTMGCYMYYVLTYVIWWAFRPLHGDLPLVHVRLIGQFNRDPFRRGFGELSQLL